MQRLFFALALLGCLNSPLTSLAAPTDTQRLTTLARVWGFLKYHHPGIAQSHLDWDSALVATIPHVLAARSAHAVNDQLAGWLTALGPLPTTPAVLPTTPYLTAMPILAGCTKTPSSSRACERPCFACGNVTPFRPLILPCALLPGASSCITNNPMPAPHYRS